ncbi:MAG TPA: hypothetical protein PK078_05095 [Anaerolineales bacterium]|nr:hypothetical protein [Anaerolineales bacterium]HNA88891.1 hypothetical protein [Anaerolineales bacterium]HNB35828.1 hypothetical protein [Anaerolineales bacterium]
MTALNCPNCGAALPSRAFKDVITTCEFCGTSFRIPKTLTPEPDMGDLILGADFSQRVNPGWELVNDDKLTFHKGKPSEIRGTFEPQTNSYYMLKSSGFLDNFDLSASIRFYEGEYDWIHAGFYVRHSSEGGYGFKISVQASYTFGHVSKDEKGELLFYKIMPWAYHRALRSGLNEVNRLRVICNGGSFRIYLNGVFATSFQDERYKMGKIYLCADPSEKSSMTVGFSDLQLREVPG